MKSLTKERRIAEICEYSPFAKFTQSHSGYEFYHKKNNQKVYLWEIHETFTPGEIEMIIQDRNGTIGYREKED